MMLLAAFNPGPFQATLKRKGVRARVDAVGNALSTFLRCLRAKSISGARSASGSCFDIPSQRIVHIDAYSHFALWQRRDSSVSERAAWRGYLLPMRLKHCGTQHLNIGTLEIVLYDNQ